MKLCRFSVLLIVLIFAACANLTNISIPDPATGKPIYNNKSIGIFSTDPRIVTRAYKDAAEGHFINAKAGLVEEYTADPNKFHNTPDIFGGIMRSETGQGDTVTTNYSTDPWGNSYQMRCKHGRCH